MDSTNITDLIFAINPGYFSYPITGSSGRVYNTSFAGRVDIEWVGIGDNCSPSTNIVANFDAGKTVVCTGEGIVFTNTSSNAPAGFTYSWNFGAGANPATATGIGPHTVTYSTSGLKSPSLIVSNGGVSNTRTRSDYINVAHSPAGCLFSDEYNNNTVSWISPLTGPFAHTEAGSDWRITTNGHGEWDAFNYTINNGNSAQPLNFGCSSNKPVLKIRVKASANCLMSISLADINGRTTDAMGGLNNLELTTSYQTFTINYAGRFRNQYGASPGMLDSLIISRLGFMVNPGFASWPVTGQSGRVYNSAFIGTIDIDWIGIGDNCAQTPTMVANFSANQTSTCSGSTITFSNNSTGTTAGTSYSWNFGQGATPATATGAGPHNVSYTTEGNKSVSLSLNSGAASETKTNYIAVTASVTPSVNISITSGSNPACSGTSLTFSATPTNGGTAPTYQWRINNVNVGTGNTLTRNNLANGDQVSCVMTSNANCASPVTATSNTITMNVTAALTPSVNISITSGSNPACSGTSLTFSATPTNGGTAPTYQWRINNVNVGTGTTLTRNNLTNGDQVSCVMTSNANCASPVTATSNTITMNVTAALTPSVNISITSGSNPACSGTSLTFSATPTNGGTAPTYQWRINNVNVGTGTTLTRNNLTNGDQVSCVMTSNANCASPVTATSNTITMNVTAALTPSVNISITSGSNPACSGASLTFSATPTNGGTAPTYQWRINNVNVGTGTTLTRNNLTNGDQVSCVMTSNANCASPVTATSNTITMNVTAALTPSVNISITSGSNPACLGTSLTFSATPTNGGTAPSYQWRINNVNVGTGTTLTRNNLANGDQVSCVMTSNAACATTTTATSNNITLAINSVPNTSSISGNTNPGCNATGLTYSVTGSAASTYVWNIPPGAQIVGNTTGNSITVNFGSSNGNITVIETSQAGCQGTQRQLAISLAGCGLAANFTASPTTVCKNATVIFTNSSTGTTSGAAYSWNFGSGASPATATGAGPHQVTYTSSGNKTVTLQVVNGVTVTESKTNYIQVIDVAQASAGQNQNITSTGTTLAGNTPSAGMGTGLWTVTSSSGSVAITNPNSATSNVSGLGEGANILRWTISNGNCTTSSEVTITVNTQHNNLVINGPSNVVPNQIYTFSIDGGANTIYNWSVPQGANLISGQGTGMVQISFNSGFTGTISVNLTANGTSTTKTKEISAIVTGQQTSTVRGKVSLYPNPCQNKTLLKYETANRERMDIKIVDQRGLSLYSEAGLWTNEFIEIGEGLPAGVWFVQVIAGDQVEIIKVVKVD